MCVLVHGYMCDRITYPSIEMSILSSFNSLHSLQASNIVSAFADHPHATEGSGFVEAQCFETFIGYDEVESMIRDNNSNKHTTKAPIYLISLSLSLSLSYFQEGEDKMLLLTRETQEAETGGKRLGTELFIVASCMSK